MYAIWNETGDMTTGIRDIKNIIRESYKTPSVHMKTSMIKMFFQKKNVNGRNWFKMK
jgi:hypothetical protein